MLQVKSNIYHFSYTNKDIFQIEKCRFSNDMPLHWHEFLEVELIEDGVGVQVLNGKSYDYRRGTISLLRISDFHEIHVREPMAGYTLQFRENAIDHQLYSGLLHVTSPLLFQLTEEQLQMIEPLFRCLMKEHEMPEENFHMQYVQCQLNLICMNILRLANQQSPSPSNQYNSIERTLLYLHQHFMEDPSLARVASIAEMHSNYFSTQFRNYTGKSFKMYLTNLKLEYAKKLLLASHLNITEICYSCGFHTPSHFCSEFQKKYQMSPLKFRSKNMEEQVVKRK